MLHATPEERLALGVTALLLALGAAVRVLGMPPAPAELTSAGAASDTLQQDDPRAVAARAAKRAADAARASSPLRAGERLDPNRATAVELERLPRVGPALAARIVAHREARGAFRSLDDLDAVPGIGPAMLEALAPHLDLPAARGGRTGAPAVDLNRATAEELEALPGIGPALAGRIVEWRRHNGDFRSTEDLLQVPGIGPALLARLGSGVKIGR